MLRSLIIILAFNLLLVFLIDFFIQKNYLLLGKYDSEKSSNAIPGNTISKKRDLSSPPKESESESKASEVESTPDTSTSLCKPRKNQLANQSSGLKFNYEICDSIHTICKEYRKNLRVNRSKGENEHYLTAEHDLPFLKGIVSQMRDSITAHNFDELNAAIYVVSFIQNIPYTLVHGNSHAQMQDYSFYQSEYGLNKAQSRAMAGKIEKFHSTKSHLRPMDQVGGCAEEVNPNGYFSPIEFLYHQMGDCDTRTILLHTMLKALGFDVLELVSDHYGHAILAINLVIPYGLHSFMYQGKKYFIWETTDVHLPGIHPKGPQYIKNINNWKVKLN